MTFTEHMLLHLGPYVLLLLAVQHSWHNSFGELLSRGQWTGLPQLLDASPIDTYRMHNCNTYLFMMTLADAFKIWITTLEK